MSTLNLIIRTRFEVWLEVSIIQSLRTTVQDKCTANDPLYSGGIPEKFHPIFLENVIPQFADLLIAPQLSRAQIRVISAGIFFIRHVAKHSNLQPAVLQLASQLAKQSPETKPQCQIRQCDVDFLVFAVRSLR